MNEHLTDTERLAISGALAYGHDMTHEDEGPNLVTLSTPRFALSPNHYANVRLNDSRLAAYGSTLPQDEDEGEECSEIEGEQENLELDEARRTPLAYEMPRKRADVVRELRSMGYTWEG